MEILKKLERIPQPTQKKDRILYLLDATEMIAEEMANKLNLRKDEVAVLLLSSDGEFLRFITPRKLFESGSTFPVTIHSVAGSAILYKRTTIYNDMSVVHNLSFFEKIKNDAKTRPLPIQKMATIPLSSKGEYLGIVQLSRKAEKLQEAGPDFTQKDLDKISELVIILSSIIQQNNPNA